LTRETRAGLLIAEITKDETSERARILRSSPCPVVLDVPCRDAEGSGELAQYEVAVFEIGTDHQVNGVKLACDQPAVIPPLVRKPFFT
jgi:hypothetical protein